MSDTLSGLQNALRGGDVLSSIAHPNIVNPLATYKDALGTASAVYSLRGQQADQAWGNALQQATDANGNVDYPRAQAIAAQMGGLTQTGMLKALGDTSNLRGQQIEQANGLNILVGKLSASVANDPSDGNIAKIRAQAQASGLPDSGLAEIDRIGALPENQRPAEALKHTLGAMNAMEQLHIQTGGKPITINQGGAVTGGTQNPITGAITTSGQPVLMTLSPEQQNATVNIPDPRRTLPDGSPNPDYAKPKPFTKAEQLQMMGYTVLPNGQVVQSGQGGGGGGGGDGGLGSGRYNTVPPALRNNQNPPPQTPPGQTPPAPAPANPAAPAIQFGGPPPAPPGGPSGASTAPYPQSGGGIGSVLAPPAPGQRSDATPPANANVAAIMQGIQNARANPLGGGTMTAGPGAGPSPAPSVERPPEPGWGTSPGSYNYGTAPAARPAPAPAQPTPPAAKSPFDRPAIGLSPAEEEQAKGAGGRFDAYTTAGEQAQAQQAVLGNILADTKQFSTGPLASIVGKFRNLAIALNLPGVNVEAQSAKESFGKLAAGLANAQGAGSDSRMNVNIQANPHEELSPAGVDLVTRQLQGNADFLQARQKLAQDWPAKSDFNGFAQSIRQLDPRVFQYERMLPDQKATWFKALDGRDQAAFMNAHGWAEKKNLIPSRPMS